MVEPFVLPRIKVCGLRTFADVASVLGSAPILLDAVGIVEHPPSPRAVSADVARELTDALPDGVLPVAVFVDRSPDEVLRWAQASGARCVQLCGIEDPQAFRDLGRPILRRLAVDSKAERELDRWRDVAAGYVLDHPAAVGGTGRAVDLDLAAKLARLAPCLLAGGLDSTNVAERVHRVHPSGVDASSRLEATPGVKDPERVTRFVDAAAAALEDITQ